MDARQLSNDYYTDQSYIPLPNLADILPWPSDPQENQSVPGLDHTGFAVTNPPVVSTLQEMWKAFSEDPVEFISYGLKTSGETVKETVREGVSEVVESVVEPIQEQTKTVYWYLLIGIIVIGGALYFVGKGGAIKQIAGLKPL